MSRQLVGKWVSSVGFKDWLSDPSEAQGTSHPRNVGAQGRCEGRLAMAGGRVHVNKFRKKTKCVILGLGQHCGACGFAYRPNFIFITGMLAVKEAAAGGRTTWGDQ